MQEKAHSERTIFGQTAMVTATPDNLKIFRPPVDLDSAELRVLLDMLPLMVTWIDSSEHYRYANQAFRALLGLPSAAIIGRTVREVTGEESYSISGAAIAALLAGEERIFERLQRMPGGGLSTIKFHCLP